LSHRRLNPQRLAVAQHAQLGHVADPQEGQPVAQKSRVPYRPGVDFRHDVTGFQAGAGSRRSLVDLDDYGTAAWG
jgi:hypothetical protein